MADKSYAEAALVVAKTHLDSIPEYRSGQAAFWREEARKADRALANVRGILEKGIRESA